MRILLLLTCSLLLAQDPTFNKAEEITYDWLTSHNDARGGTSHVICFKEIFDLLKVKSLLEFGIGTGTKYFLDSCKKVISVEVITHGYGPERCKRFLELYKGCSNWTPIVYFSGFQGDMSWAHFKYMGSDAVYKAASYQCSTWLHYKNIDPFYLKELGDFMTNLTKYNKVEAALVQPMLFLRGDMVQLLFDKVGVIVAHNTASRVTGKETPFGYVRVKTPDNYEEIYLPTEQEGEVIGTTVWILKKPEHEPLIERLKALL
jgi:hypothetical protein